MIKFADVVSTKTSKCKKCFALVYTLPVHTDKELATYLSKLGRPAYPLNVSGLLRINIKQDYYIENRIGSKHIKLSMPRAMESVKHETIKEKIMFEQGLLLWMRDRLNMNILP